MGRRNETGKSNEDGAALVLTDVPAEEYAKHNYLPLLLEHYRARGAPKGVHRTEIRHDDWCLLLGGRGPCNCNPEIVSRSPNRAERRRGRRRGK